MPLRSELTAREALSKVGRALHTLQTDNIEGHTLSSGANLGHLLIADRIDVLVGQSDDVSTRSHATAVARCPTDTRLVYDPISNSAESGPARKIRTRDELVTLYVFFRCRVDVQQSSACMDSRSSSLSVNASLIKRSHGHGDSHHTYMSLYRRHPSRLSIPPTCVKPACGRTPPPITDHQHVHTPCSYTLVRPPASAYRTRATFASCPCRPSPLPMPYLPPFRFLYPIYPFERTSDHVTSHSRPRRPVALFRPSVPLSSGFRPSSPGARAPCQAWPRGLSAWPPGHRDGSSRP